MQIVNASIITIGDELLIGQTVDTNSAFIGQELNRIGVWVRRRVAVGDVWDDIRNALDEESQESDIIIITGGLGPTADDITKPLLCEYFGGKLIVDEKVLQHVKDIFTKLSRPIIERNMKQAEVPDVCDVLFNKRGTAPGMWFGPRRREAPLNPPQGGALKSYSSKDYYNYTTADTTVYGLLKNFVAEHRSNPTEAEKVLWSIVRGKKMSGFKFRRQHIISDYIADFVCLSSQLIIEVDGLYHQLPENKISDEERTNKLNSLGFKIIRFTNEQVLNETDSVVNKILQELNETESLMKSRTPPSEGLGEAGPIFISLPGVPYEMKGLIIDEVIPRLQKEFTFPAIVHKTIFTAGQGESFIAETIKDVEASLPSHIKLAYLPGFGLVKLRLTARGDNKDALEKELTPYVDKLKELLKDFIVTESDEGLEVVIGKILKEKNKTMATAESCTGGNIAHMITSVAGSSNYYKGSVVSYANEVKENILNVKHDTLESVGAVSEETVLQMVKGVIEKLNVDYAVATSGIMGPDGGTTEKPVGTVWIGVGDKNKMEAKKFYFRFDRERNIEQTSLTALNMLRKFILSEP